MKVYFRRCVSVAVPACFYLGLACLTLSVHAVAGPGLKSKTPKSKGVKRSLTLLWSQKLPGAISSLSAAPSGEVLVATNPDPDIVGSSSRFLLTRYNAHGKIAWQKVMDEPVKEQDLSADAKITVVSNYGDRLLVYNAQGKLLWTAQGTCKPYFLNKSQKILCYHDEDVDPKIAFDLYDLKGNRLVSYPISGDILGFKLAMDQRAFGAGLTQGRVVLFSDDGALKWQKQLPGEVVDLAVSSGPIPRMAVLLREVTEEGSPVVIKGKKQRKKIRLGGQTLYVLNENGETLRKVQLPVKALQVEMTPTGDRVFYYGCSHAGSAATPITQFFKEDLLPPGRGQILGSLNLSKNHQAKDWVHGLAQPSVYFHPFVVGRSGVFFGVESSQEDSQSSAGFKDRGNQLLLINETGDAAETLPISSDEGAFFYAHRVAEGSATRQTRVVVSTDDGRVNVYSVAGRE